MAICTLFNMNEVKFVYASRNYFVFTCYQPDGSGRGIPSQPLPEIVPTGYYTATPLTDLEEGDMVVAYFADRVTYGGSPVIVLAPSSLVYEGKRVYYEEKWVFDYANMGWCNVRSYAHPAGAGEYTLPASYGLSATMTAANTIAETRDETIKPETLTVLRNL